MANPTRAGVPGQYLTPYNLTVSYGNQGAHIIQNNGADWFGPLDPIAPTAPQEVKGRTWDFPSGYNLNTQPRTYEPVTFHTLRALADGYDVLRLVIETRKDQIGRMSWAIKSRDAKLKDKNDPRIEAITALFKRPDGERGWTDWLRSVLEDLLVIDAPTLYMQRNRGGKLIALMQLDGATIKPVIDDWGRTPQPFANGSSIVYPTAYQQVLKGIPAIDYSTRDLIYRPRNKRINHAYGFSPVEQIMTTVNIALRRQLFTLSYFTDGNIPDSFIPVPPEWTPDQIITYQKNFDAYFTGDLAARRRAKFVPGGVGKGVVETKQPELTGEFDNFLHRIICFAFGVSPQALTKMMNRASAETQKESADEEGLQPILEWIKTFIDDVLALEFDAKDLEFAWDIDDEVDRTTQQTILTGYVSKGIMTIDESRDELGLDPFNTPESSQPMIITATGMVPLDSFAQGQQQATAQLQANAEAKAKMEANGGLQPAQGDGKNGNRPPVPAKQDGAEPGKKKPPTTSPKVAKAANRPLYVSRNLTNADDLITWAKSQGFATTLAADDLHVTVCYSKTAMDWSTLGASSDGVKATGGNRQLHVFGKGAVVLQFECGDLQDRHDDFCEAGASFDYPEYRPHVTITYDAGDVDLDKVAPYTGPLNFGPEIFAEIDDDWSTKLTESAPQPSAEKSFNPDQARGSDGKWTSGGDTSAMTSKEAAWHNTKLVLKGVALTAVGSLAIALAPEEGAAAAAVVGIGLVVKKIADSMFLTAGLSSAKIALHSMGVQTEHAEEILGHIGDMFKAAGPDKSAELRSYLAKSADQTLEFAVEALKKKDLDQSQINMGEHALAAAHKQFVDGLGAISITKAHGFNKRRGTSFRRPEPIPFDRPATSRAEKRIKSTLAASLAALGKLAANLVRAKAEKFAKAAPDEPEPDEDRISRYVDDIVSEFDMSLLQDNAGDIGDELADVLEDASAAAVAQVATVAAIGSADAADLVNQVNTRAVAFARERAAELVGMKFDDDGNLVPSDNPDMAITDTTRDMLRQTITDGLADNLGMPEIADLIEESYGFSEDRAALIAATEVSRANSMAAVESYRDIADSGVDVQKEWLVASECCDVCKANRDQGPIDLDEDFSSGDDAPPAHPNCRCSVSPVVRDGK